MLGFVFPGTISWLLGWDAGVGDGGGAEHDIPAGAATSVSKTPDPRGSRGTPRGTSVTAQQAAASAVGSTSDA